MYYFDNSATTRPSQEILDVFNSVSYNYFGNPSSSHSLGEKANSLLFEARNQIANLLNFNTDEIYFTGSGTESNNWVLQGILPALFKRHPNKNRVLISSIEHPSIMQQINKIEQMGVKVDLLPVDINGCIDIDRTKLLISDDVLLISTMAVNNEVGALQPLEAIADILEDYPQIIWHVDGVQAMTVAYSQLLNKRIDVISLSSHKFHSVKGIGILAKKERVAAYPILYGGGQERNLRSSTENLAGIVATSKAMRLAVENQTVAIESIGNFRQELIKILEKNGWTIFCANNASAHILCAALPPVPGEVLLHAFEKEDIFISTTSACSSRKHAKHATLTAMGIPTNISSSAIRISMSQHTTEQEIAYLCSKIPLITQQFNV